MSYSNDQKKMNPKMHFLHFSVIKIPKDYFRESAPTVQICLVENQHNYSRTRKEKTFTDQSSTVKQPWAWKDESTNYFPLQCK